MMSIKKDIDWRNDGVNR